MNAFNHATVFLHGVKCFIHTSCYKIIYWINVSICSVFCVAAKKDEVEVPEKEAKEKHEKAWDGGTFKFYSLLLYINRS